jgi:tetratricopeptide (TPR) repeat protein
MPSDTRYRKGDTIGGQFLVHQALQGGMGEVYLCLTLQDVTPCALKTFQQKYHFDPQSRALFNEEVSTWVALDQHPHIVRCFFLQDLDNQPFMVLEWVAGEKGRGTDLRGWLRRGPLDLRLALDFIIDICRGLIHANEKQPGIVHRDLKPDNILVSQGRLAKITDFGLAMVAQRANLDLANDDAADNHTTHPQTRRAGGMVGTFPYMPPEQWQGAAVDARADIYAVGCILYELLTGQFPYTATTISGFRRQHEQAALPTLPGDSGLPPALNGLLAGCMAKRPDERFPDVAALLDAVTTLYRQQVGAEPRPQPEAGEFTAIDYSNRGTTYQMLQKFEEALEDFNRAIAADPTDPEVYSARGGTYSSLGRFDEALADFTRAMELDPTFAPPYYNRGNLYIRMQWLDEALNDYTRAIELGPADVPFYVNRGSTYQMLERYSEALADYARAIDIDPGHANTYYNRGHLYEKQGSIDAALADYSRAIELDPIDYKAYNNRGDLYARLEQYQAALTDYIRAIECEPARAEGYNNCGTIYLTWKRYDEALKYFTRAIELDPSYATAYNNRGVVYKDMKRSEEALADYARAIELDPSYDDPYTNRGGLYADLGLYNEALTDYARALELDPTNATAYNNRGNTYRRLGCAAEAMADYQNAIAIRPTYAKAHLNIGGLLIQQDRPHEALPYLDQATQLGNTQATELAVLIREALEMVPEDNTHQAPRAFDAMFDAHSLDDMRRVVAQYPALTDYDVLQNVEEFILQDISPPQRQQYAPQLSWLRTIAREQGKW